MKFSTIETIISVSFTAFITAIVVLNACFSAFHLKSIVAAYYSGLALGFLVTLAWILVLSFISSLEEIE